jgi:altronate hydrolase
MDTLRLDPSDNLVVARRSLKAGEVVNGMTLKDAVPAGHKIATEVIPKGAVVRKFAQLIGFAFRLHAGDEWLKQFALSDY